MSTANDRSFVQWGAWRRALAAARRALGLSIDAGSVSQLPGGGASLRFDFEEDHPFLTVFAGNGRIWMHEGFVIYAGSIVWFPSQLFVAGREWTLALSIPVSYDISAGTSPAENQITIARGGSLSIAVHPLGSIGTEALVRDTDPGSDESLVSTDGTVLWPIASGSNGRVFQHLAEPLVIDHLPNGQLKMAQGYFASR